MLLLVMGVMREKQLKKTCRNGARRKHSITISSSLNADSLTGSPDAQLSYFKNAVRSGNISALVGSSWQATFPSSGSQLYCCLLPHPSGIPVGTGRHTANERKVKRCNWDETKDFKIFFLLFLFPLTEAACCEYTLLNQTHSRLIGHSI